MNTPLPSLSRRHFIGASLAALATPGLTRASVSNPSPGAQVEGFAPYLMRSQAWIRSGNRIVACYRAHPTQKFPYLYPLAGPLTGLPVTEETGTPFPHHSSLYFACDRINGLDFWHAHNPGGSIRSTSLEFTRADGQEIELVNACDWNKDSGETLMRDKRTLVFRHVPGKHTIIDWDISWEAVVPVTLQKTNHSLFSMRAARDLTPAGGGTLVNAEGARAETGTFGKPSAWCDFYGSRSGLPAGTVEGICMMDHPQNPWAPTAWFTRNYGFASPTPLNFIPKPVEMQPGKPLRFRYRVVSHAGDPGAAGLNDLYKAFSG